MLEEKVLSQQIVINIFKVSALYVSHTYFFLTVYFPFTLPCPLSLTLTSGLSQAGLTRSMLVAEVVLRSCCALLAESQKKATTTHTLTDFLVQDMELDLSAPVADMLMISVHVVRAST